MMAENSHVDAMYDPRQGSEAICLQRLDPGVEEFEPRRTNYFAIYRIDSGTGTFWADASRFSFGPSSLIFFTPYQHIRISPNQPVQGEIVHFHANFLCVETFHAEAGCSGILFNDPQGIPIVELDQQTAGEITRLIEEIRKEQQQCRLGFRDVMLAQLKVLLILATRSKSTTGQENQTGTGGPRHPVLMAFRELIERNYCRLHAPADYAALLHVTPKTLGRIVRETLATTPSELIRSRMLTHAKWQLLHTLRPVKEIAREVGFRDELYFSRLFKKATGCSPTFFRQFETEIRGGSNLSMVLSDAPIPNGNAAADTSSRIAQ